jgi:hypothetical protein
MDGYFRIFKDKNGYYAFIDIQSPDIDAAGYSSNSTWFSAIPACRGVQLDRDLLLHVLHINGVSHCVLFPRLQVRPEVVDGCMVRPIPCLAWPGQALPPLLGRTQIRGQRSTHRISLWKLD